jgi:hypothetical protein
MAVGVPDSAFATPDYVDAFVAIKAKALLDHGTAFVGANSVPYPGYDIATAKRAVDWYGREVGRLTGLTAAGWRVATSEDGYIAEDLPRAALLQSPLNGVSARKVWDAWREARPKLIFSMLNPAQSGVTRFWDVLSKLSIDMQVEKTTPDYQNEIWGYLLDSAKERSAEAVEAMAAAAVGVLGFGGRLVWAMLGGPLIVAGLVGLAIYFREPIMKRLA